MSRPPLSRRRAITLLGVGAAGVVVAGSGAVIGVSAMAESDDAGTAHKGAALPSVPATVASWAARRGSGYYIAHRGSGDVLPEHSMPAYRAAADWGAQCLEVSVGMTSDGLLICMHDLTYDRTTTGSGEINAQSSSVLENIRIMQPRLGQAWVDNPPRVPLFEDVLKAFGGRVVLAVEAKLSAAYEPMMAMVRKYKLQASVIVKVHYRSKRRVQAQAAGYPVFCYFGSEAEAQPADIAAVAAELDPKRDCLVIPGFTATDSYLPDSVVAAAVATGVPVWAFPLHRRADAAHFFDLGVVGAVCSSYGYLAGTSATLTADDWSTQAIAAGEMTADPADDRCAPSFTPAGEVVLAAVDRQHFLTLGQFGPMPGGRFTLDVDLCWKTPPSTAGELTVVFGCNDDAYVEGGLVGTTGYQLRLGRNGSLGLYQVADGSLLAPELATPELVDGQWTGLRIAVDDTDIIVSRAGTEASTRITVPTAPGGYLHLGRGSTDGVAMFRSLRLASG